ncbi:ALPHA-GALACTOSIDASE [Salix koriyanagi]|uniref:ALPHA-GALACTOSIDASE n=1 Tax=Salix koriyanagi TaxID=2511006 RepID=A0A9Q0WLJ6_9ROSI|nr:ALPHA-GALACTOSIDASE [Salix koriyanagi]
MVHLHFSDHQEELRTRDYGDPTTHLSVSLSLFFFSSFSLYRVSFQPEHASFPPREDFLRSAEIISHRLKPYGYEYAVIDYLWYRRDVPGASTDSHGFDVIDEWGRMIPYPARWPSSKEGRGFTGIAKKVHSMGLKFGIHIMRGLSRQEKLLLFSLTSSDCTALQNLSS